MSLMKKCSVCMNWLPITAFHKDKYRPHGYKSQCKKCRSIYEKEGRKYPCSLYMKNDFKVFGDFTIIYVKACSGKMYEFIIDTCCLPLAMNINGYWYASMKKKGDDRYIYAAAYVNGLPILLHRLLTDAPKGRTVDHIDHDTKNNRLNNLRTVSHQKNQQNRIEVQKNNKSGARGVYWQEKQRKWCVTLKVNGKSLHFGSFSTLEQAKDAVKTARKEVMPYSL